MLCVVLPLTAFASESNQKVVRVGWYESAFHHTDEFGRRSGYGYEYQKRIAIYTGWTYEYVEGSWSELLEKLIAGEIDLLTDVSYTEERTEKILYSAEAMGSEGYHVFIAPDNTEIRPDDFSTLNGKRVGVNKNSIQEQLFIDWAGNHNVTAEIVESTEKTPVLLEMLARGEFDALVTLDTYGNSADVVPVWKVGFAESYFGINKNRPDLKQELDVAMNRLFEDNRDFNQQLTEKFNRASSVNSFLTPEEKDWLSGHETIRVGYRNNFLPFCDLDEETQSLTGFLADYLEFAQTAEKNAQLSFDTTAFATTGDALQALERGEIDCIFPLNLSSYDGEKYGVIITDPLVSTEMYAVVRTSDGQGISRDRELTVAVIHDNPNYNTFQMDYFPSWEIAYYDNTESAFQAVADGKADAGLVSNYRISLVSDLIEKNKLAALTTGEVMDVSFAVRQEDDCLYSILNKITGLIPDATVNSLLTNYSLRENRITFREFILDNLIYFIIAVAVVAVVILLLVIRNLKIQAKEEEGRQIISEAERDPLTGLYNWNFFLVYAGRLYNEHPEKPMDAVVININRFHSVNALHGREFGDIVLRALGEEINNFLLETEGIASRFEADRFDIYCAHRDDWQTLYDRFQARLDSLFHNASIHLRMGVKPWQDGMDTVTQFDCARTACNSTRGDYKARAVIYDDIMGQREERDQKLLSDLSRALEQHELEVYYQPKYNIQAPQPKLASAEALVRWRHPELGLISPDEFIPLYEQSGQISVLDSFVWEAAARQIADWKTRYGTALPVSVNVSRVDVFDPALESILEGLVSRYGLNHSELKLEITESAYTENAEQLIQVIGHLREKGYEIEMDDFGSGYSSLNMLSSMPIDILKMDIAFIRNIEQSEKDFHLVELIIDIARYLKVPVIAEGVENENQLRLLKDAGCDLVQGYYFSRPLPVDEFERKILGF
jgi:EAL domain-containing protein (putative c-di-GMP-specific phosphodiesterase class I)/ABC-type amino acid transport substrate-binding protein/GGDEF domain-containing protein